MIRQILAAALALLSVPVSAAPRCPPDTRVMTYNIRLDTPADGPNRWDLRRDLLVAQLHLLRPDILGLQEVVPGQLADLAAALPGHARIGSGRDGHGAGGEASPLFISRAAFAVRTHGQFWLSPTPEKTSRGWDAAFPRIVTFAHLRRRSDGARVLALNTHWDHVGKQARLESARQIARWLAANRQRGEAVVVLGDFNAELAEPSVQALLAEGKLTDARTAAGRHAQGTAISFNAFKAIPASGSVIDHVLIDPAIRVRRWHLLAEHFDGRVASDHFPVIADLSFSSGGNASNPALAACQGGD